MRAISADAARDFLKQAAELGEWTESHAAKTLGAGAKTVHEALLALAGVGYIEKVKGKRGTWKNTSAGNELAGVSAARKIRRDTAEKQLAGFLERAEQVNRDPHFLYRVKRAYLFGPYLAGEEHLADLDLAVELEPKQRNDAAHERLVTKRAEQAEAQGKRFASFKKKMQYGETEVLEFLKSRSRTLSIGTIAPWVLKQPHKVIFHS